MIVLYDFVCMAAESFGDVYIVIRITPTDIRNKDLFSVYTLLF